MYMEQVLIGEIWTLVLDKLKDVVKYAVGYTCLEFKRVIRLEIKMDQGLRSGSCHFWE